MNAIVAVDKNWAIGYKGDLLMRIREDLKRFKKLTTGNVVIMGYNTLLSMPGSKPLPDRTTIVLYPEEIDIKGATVCHSVHETLSEIKKYDTRNVFICGGGMIYKQFIDYCDTAYITKIDREFQADTFFPSLDHKPEWSISAHEGTGVTPEGVSYEYLTYKK